MGVIAKRDLERALAFEVARQIVYESATGKKAWGGSFEISKIKEGLSPERAAAAEASGRQYAEQILKTRTR
ncbi:MULTISPECIES: hypothetical protein [unclassified Rubrivivax]|uniref:hypothetical protein n=1 Tax=unclassified Rubrivivax TaxID=2649762 RepID=UPI001E3131E8|nr:MULTISPECIES: hypothetical protein [unclassified Rubrivivax]MCC9597413.1 hypothetical protein [Rubrivivax sp. JA1055]MCC9646330.1 hypothetical protein [Rubrivivax sp. JA1029]